MFVSSLIKRETARYCWQYKCNMMFFVRSPHLEIHVVTRESNLFIHIVSTSHSRKNQIHFYIHGITWNFIINLNRRLFLIWCHVKSTQYNLVCRRGEIYIVTIYHCGLALFFSFTISVFSIKSDFSGRRIWCFPVVTSLTLASWPL